MNEIIQNWLNFFLGLEHETLTFFHMSIRGLIVYIFGSAIIHINKRFIALHTQFDFILYVMLGSILAGAIIGDAPFFAVLGMTLLLISLNWALVKITAYSPFLDVLLKGKPILLIDNGLPQFKHMKQNSITPEDLLCFLRIQTGTMDITQVEKAYLETNGTISFILKRSS